MKVSVTDIRADVLDYCKRYPATLIQLMQAYGHSETSLRSCIRILVGAGYLKACQRVATSNLRSGIQYLTTPRGEAAMSRLKATREAA